MAGKQLLLLLIVTVFLSCGKAEPNAKADPGHFLVEVDDNDEKTSDYNGGNGHDYYGDTYTHPRNRKNLYGPSGDISIKANNLLHTIPHLKKEFVVEFYLKPSKFLKGWSNVLHMTTGCDYGKYGCRTPAVWFGPGDDGRLVLQSAVNGAIDYGYGVQPAPIIPAGKWTHISIAQFMEGEKMKFEVRINGLIIKGGNVTNNSPQDFHNVKVYASDPWHQVQPGVIRGLNIK